MSGLWQVHASPLVRFVVQLAFGEGVIGRSLLGGLDAGVNAALSVGIPYVLTFYFRYPVSSRMDRMGPAPRPR